MAGVVDPEARLLLEETLQGAVKERKQMGKQRLDNILITGFEQIQLTSTN